MQKGKTYKRFSTLLVLPSNRCNAFSDPQRSTFKIDVRDQMSGRLNYAGDDPNREREDRMNFCRCFCSILSRKTTSIFVCCRLREKENIFFFDVPTATRYHHSCSACHLHRSVDTINNSKLAQSCLSFSAYPKKSLQQIFPAIEFYFHRRPPSSAALVFRNSKLVVTCLYAPLGVD